MWAACLLRTASGFTWQLHNEIIYADSSLTFSEQYMYGSDGETASIFHGKAFIRSAMHVQAILSKNISTTFIAFAAYDASRTHHDSSLVGLCSGQARLNITTTDKNNRWASEVAVERFPLATYQGSYEAISPYDDDYTFNTSTTAYVYSADVDTKYVVGRDGWYNVALMFCDGSFSDVVDGGGNGASRVTKDRVRSRMLRVSSNRGVRKGLGRPSRSLVNSRQQNSYTREDNAASAVSASVPNVPPQSPSTYTNSDTDTGNGGDGSYYSYVSVSGSISFKNPYGYLPAGLFGVLPFQSGLCVGYVAVAAIFGAYMKRYQRTLIAMQYGVLVVLLFAIVETALWLGAYFFLNATGVPYCCPFPPIIVASLVLQIARQAVCRALLLVVTLGYGIVRPRLYPMEWGAIGFITVLYYVAATAAQLMDVEVMASLGRSDQPDTSASASDTLNMAVHAVETVIDATFLAWIYLSLSSTIRVLREFRQTYKLSIYNRLSTAIIVFIALFAAITVLVMLDRMGIVVWPWQLGWVPLVLWPLLNFSILTSVSIICLPSDRSRMLSYASQLPTFDPDAGTLEEFNDTASSITSIGEAGHAHGRGNPFGDDDDGFGYDDDDDGLNAPHNRQRYDLMTPPNRLLQYRQQLQQQGHFNGGGHGVPSSAGKYNVRINPIIAGGNAETETMAGGAGGGGRAQSREGESLQQFEHSIVNPALADLSVDEREFEMIMRGEKPSDLHADGSNNGNADSGSSSSDSTGTDGRPGNGHARQQGDDAEDDYSALPDATPG